MLFLQTGVVLEEQTLFLSPGRPQDWMIQAASVSFDLDQAQKQGRVKMVWIPASAPGPNMSDALASRAVEDLVHLIMAERPQRVLINDFVPFLQFRSFDRFRQVFGWMMGQLATVQTTVLLMMPDVINAQSQHIMEFMRNQMSGSMHVSMPEGAKDAGPTGSRRLVLWPGLGHVTHEVVDPWDIPMLSLTDNPSGLAGGQLESLGNPGSHDTPASPFEAASTTITPESLSLAGMPVPSVAVDSLRALENSHAAFFAKLKKSFKQRASKKYKPFLLVALRMEAEQSTPDGTIGLDMLLPAIEQIVVHPEDILVDVGRGRIIAFLPNKKGDNVQEFFESIQDQLREKYPSVAEQLPHVVSAVVVPNGEPFENPEDFLAYALEGN